MLKKIFYSVMITTMMCMISTCGSERGNPEADALRNMVDSQSVAIEQMNLLLDAVNVSLDSVVNMEGGLIRIVGESPLSVKDQIKQNIEAYKLILQHQHERIDELEKQLKTNDANSAKMLKTITTMKQQLTEKEQAIVELTEELEKRNFDIAQLKKDVVKLNTKVNQLQEETMAQEEILEAQSDMMNEAYVAIGSSKQLKETGIISGGSLFKKAKFDPTNTTSSLFRKIDIRKELSFSIPAKKAQVLTQMPSDSYSINSNGDGTCTLVVTDANRFWSVSNYLVVKY